MSNSLCHFSLFSVFWKLNSLEIGRMLPIEKVQAQQLAQKKHNKNKAQQSENKSECP